MVVFIKSINKIAIVAFLVTLIFIAYEISLFLKQKRKEKKPSIPEFKADQKYGQIKVASVELKEKKETFRRPNQKVIFILIISLFVFGSIFLVGVLSKEQTISPKQEEVIVAPLPQIVTSSGIKIYNERWEEIEEGQLESLKIADSISIGIKNIPMTDIKKARIRVNNDVWRQEDETASFNEELDVFYRPYQIGSDESQLKIEAQLFSEKEGWLAE